MISTKVKDRVICFMDKSTKFITQEQEQVLFSPTTTAAGAIRIEGDYINLKSITRVMSVDEYYGQFPDRRPHTYKNFSTDAFKWEKVGKKKALEQMIIGLQNYIDGPDYQGTNAPQKILENMKIKLSTCEV